MKLAQKRTPDKDLAALARAEMELQDAMEAAGMEAQTHGLFGLIWKIFFRKGPRVLKNVDKKRYIWLTVLTGWFGGHRFYSGRYVLGVLYLGFFWTLIPFMMAVLDLLEVIPKKADETGQVLI